tara:strand:+ start:34 stop:480 length:447 start_codon:yes stop_codon:yes gene_type:complete
VTLVQALTGEHLAAMLRENLPDVVESWNHRGVWVKPSAIAEVCGFLKVDEFLDFQYLNSISAVDFIEFFEVVYHLTSISYQHTAMVKTRLYGRDDLVMPSVLHLWRGADFQEREIWDLMGIRFEGHPNMKRIMLWEGFDGHPLRKDFL